MGFALQKNIPFFFFNLFIYLLLFFWLCWVFVSVRGLSLVAAIGGHSSSRWRGPLTITASLVAEHRLQARRLSSCGSQAQLLRGMWDLPRPGLEPVSPALAGRFSTTAPPGKPSIPFIHSEAFHLIGRRNSLNKPNFTTQVGKEYELERTSLLKVSSPV